MNRMGIIDAVLWILASPILAVQFAVRAIRRLRFLKIATTPSIFCECGDVLSLVGIWKCSCGFTYRGHLLTFCPVCLSLPCVIRCYGCGLTSKLPEP